MTVSINNWLAHIINNLCALIAIMVFAGFLGFKPKFKKFSVLIIAAFTVVSTALNILLYTFIGDTRFPTPVYFVLYFGFQLAAALIFFNGSVVLRLLVFFVNKVIDILSGMLFNYIMLLGGVAPPSMTAEDSYRYPTIYYAGLVILTALLNMLLMVILKMLRDKKQQISNLAFMLVPVSQIALYFAYYFLSYKYGHEVYEMNTLVTVGVVVSVIADVLMFFLVRGIRDKAVLSAQLEVMNAQQEAVLAQTRNLDAVNKKLRTFNHDVVNSLSTVNLLLREGKTEEAESIVNGISESLSSYNSKELCSNPVINAVLAMKSALAEQNGVKLKLDIDIREEITVKSLDVCSLFANILDNAIEAVCALEPERREITMQAFTRAGTLHIVTRNPSRADIVIENNRIKTTKDGELHGLGLMIIENIANNNGGGMRITSDGGEFALALSMNC